MNQCRHGVEWKSTKIWNENCAQCQSAADAYTRNLDKLHQGSGDMRGERLRRDISARRGSAGLQGDYWREEWYRRRHLGINRRKAIVKKRLTGPPHLHPAVERVLLEYADTFTEKQWVALVYSYGYGLSQREAAEHLGIGRQAFRKALEGGRKKLDRLLDRQAAEGEWTFHPFKTPYGNGYVYKDTGEPVSDEDLAEYGFVAPYDARGLSPKKQK